MTSARVVRALPWASAVVMVGVILAYAGLLPLSRWQADEFITVAFMRDFGWGFYKNWYLTWSPRLWSDILFIAYGGVVNATHRSWAAACMALLWGGLAWACVGPALARGRRQIGPVLLGLTMMAAFLAGHGDSEVFFWPAGGLSYVPTLATAAWLFWLFADEQQNSWGWHAQAAVALTLMGGSSEVGVMLALAICGAVAAARMRRGVRTLAWLLPGFIMSLIDLGLVVHGRVGAIEGAAATSPIAHHALASLLAAIPSFGREVISPPYEASGAAQAASTLAARVLLLAGARWLAPSPTPGRTNKLLLPFAGALALGAFATLASAYYQFGLVCCDRHETLRACFLSLALIAVGVWSAQALPRQTAGLSGGAAAMMLGMLLLFVPSLPAILHDYRAMPAILRADRHSWKSGRSAASDQMKFIMPPAGRIVSVGGWAPGTYHVEAKDLPWNYYAVLLFFQKKTLVVE
jgi:hypothetical protein